jgi:hypothetical protein
MRKSCKEEEVWPCTPSSQTGKGEARFSNGRTPEEEQIWLTTCSLLVKRHGDVTGLAFSPALGYH